MESQGPVTLPEGQVAVEPQTGTNQPAPEGNTGQSAAPDQGQGQAPSAPAPVSDEPTFFDPSKVSPDLMPAYKLMQGEFTRKSQAISKDRQKIEAYDRFEKDTQFQAQVLQQLAAQHGYSLTRRQANQMINDAQAESTADWQPQTWGEVLSKAEEAAERRIMERLGPWMDTVKQVQATNIESQLTKLDPNWRVYEEDMRANLREHPSLVNDVAKLYRLSVPEDVFQAKATQEALKRLQGKAQSAQVGDKSSSRSAPVMKKAKSFSEAVEIAKAKILEGR